jgi:hypothetical protein
MNSSRLASLLTLALSALWAVSGLAAPTGPTSTLYLVNYGEFSGGNISGLDLVQGLTENSFPTGNLVDTAIAASGDIRTMGYVLSESGSRFGLAGNPLPGGPYLNNYGGQLHDGTSDGFYNYAVDYVSGNVLQFDRNWASPVTLFNPNGPGTTGWITMNAADGSFWLSWYGGPDKVEHRSHTGTLLISFNSGVAGNQGLALDPVDGTLWTSSSGYVLYQFDQSGNLLQTLPVSVSGGGYWYGMEFDITPVPEPASLVLAGAGLASLLWPRRKQLVFARSSHSSASHRS